MNRRTRTTRRNRFARDDGLFTEKKFTIADGLRTNVGEPNFAIIQRYVDDIVTVSEEAIVSAMRTIWETMKIIVEPSAAVPYAVNRQEAKNRHRGKRVGIILHRRQCRSRCVAVGSVVTAVSAAGYRCCCRRHACRYSREATNFFVIREPSVEPKPKPVLVKGVYSGMKGLSLIIAAFILLFGTVASRGANLDKISAETGVPVATLQAERASTGLGWGGLEKAHLLANASGQSFETIVGKFHGREGWGQIAHDYGLNLGKRRERRAPLKSGKAHAKNNQHGPWQEQ